MNNVFFHFKVLKYLMYMQYGFSFIPSHNIIFAIKRGELFKMHTNKILSTGSSLYYKLLSVLFNIF